MTIATTTKPKPMTAPQIESEILVVEAKIAAAEDACDDLAHERKQALIAGNDDGAAKAESALETQRRNLGRLQERHALLSESLPQIRKADARPAYDAAMTRLKKAAAAENSALARIPALTAAIKEAHTAILAAHYETDRALAAARTAAAACGQRASAHLEYGPKEIEALSTAAIILARDLDDGGRRKSRAQ
jgi:hypothetical protein